MTSIKSLLVLLLMAVSFLGFSQNIPPDLLSLKKSLADCPQYMASFTLELDYPEQEVIKYDGDFVKAAEDFKLRIDKRTWIKNASILYYVDDESQEVNINSIEEEDEILTPYSFLQNLDNDHYEFYPLEAHQKYKIFDLKPLTEEDYFKIRVQIDQKELHSVKVFNKDGSRFLFVIQNNSCSTTPEKKSYTYRSSDYKDYFIEDLRID